MKLATPPRVGTRFRTGNTTTAAPSLATINSVGRDENGDGDWDGEATPIATSLGEHNSITNYDANNNNNNNDSKEYDNEVSASTPTPSSTFTFTPGSASTPTPAPTFTSALASPPPPSTAQSTETTFFTPSSSPPVFTPPPAPYGGAFSPQQKQQQQRYRQQQQERYQRQDQRGVGSESEAERDSSEVEEEDTEGQEHTNDTPDPTPTDRINVKSNLSAIFAGLSGGRDGSAAAAGKVGQNRVDMNRNRFREEREDGEGDDGEDGEDIVENANTNTNDEEDREFGEMKEHRRTKSSSSASRPPPKRALPAPPPMSTHPSTNEAVDVEVRDWREDEEDLEEGEEGIIRNDTILTIPGISEEGSSESGDLYEEEKKRTSSTYLMHHGGQFVDEPEEMGDLGDLGEISDEQQQGHGHGRQYLGVTNGKNEDEGEEEWSDSEFTDSRRQSFASARSHTGTYEEGHGEVEEEEEKEEEEEGGYAHDESYERTEEEGMTGETTLESLSSASHPLSTSLDPNVSFTSSSLPPSHSHSYSQDHDQHSELDHQDTDLSQDHDHDQTQDHSQQVSFDSKQSYLPQRSKTIGGGEFPLMSKWSRDTSAVPSRAASFVNISTSTGLANTSTGAVGAHTPTNITDDMINVSGSGPSFTSSHENINLNLNLNTTPGPGSSPGTISTGPSTSTSTLEDSRFPPISSFPRPAPLPFKPRVAKTSATLPPPALPPMMGGKYGGSSASLGSIGEGGGCESFFAFGVFLVGTNEYFT